jgi:hypothetical protein
MRTKFLAGLLGTLVAVMVGATPALALENLKEEAAGPLVAVGTNFSAENVGEPELKTALITIKCKKSTVGGTVKENASGTTNSSEIQSVVFTECTEGGGTKVIVRTKTATPWTLAWEAAKVLRLTGISAEIEILRNPVIKCIAENEAAPTFFDFTWTNAAKSELAASKQKLKLKNGANCPVTTGEETATYKLNAVGDAKNNLWLE